MTKRRWINTASGVLILEGTRFKIEYVEIKGQGHCVLRGDGDQEYLTLSVAKAEAERRQAELDEMGITE